MQIELLCWGLLLVSVLLVTVVVFYFYCCKSKDSGVIKDLPKLEIGDLVLTTKGKGWVCGIKSYKSRVCVKLLKDKDLFKPGVLVNRSDAKLIRKRFPKSLKDQEGKVIENLITKCVPITNPRYVCPWCRLSPKAEELIGNIFGYPECCQEYYLYCAPQTATRRTKDQGWRSWCNKYAHNGVDNTTYYKTMFRPLLDTVSKPYGGDGSLPAGLTQWCPCQKCFVDYERILTQDRPRTTAKGKTTYEKVDERQAADMREKLKEHFEPLFSRGYSMDTEIDTPFEPEFYDAMMKHVGGDPAKRGLVREILQSFDDVVFEDQVISGTDGRVISKGFSKEE